MKIGFLGLGIMGAPMAANLLRGGHEIMVWNRTADKCAPLVELGAGRAGTPAEVVASSDVTFAMLADPHAAERVMFGSEGALAGMGNGLQATACRIGMVAENPSPATRRGREALSGNGLPEKRARWGDPPPAPCAQ